MYFVLENTFLLIASLHSPGYCVDMEGDIDVEKATLLNKEASTVPKRGSICKECGIKRPLRSCHCAEYKILHLLHSCRCDRCIVRFDHHDVIINNCVGYANQQYFFFFLLSGFILPLYFFYTSLTSSSSSHFFTSIFHFFIWIIAVLFFSFEIINRLSSFYIILLNFVVSYQI